MSRPRLLAWLLLPLCVFVATGVRVQTALDDPAFDSTDPTGMLRSDPALLVYLTERLVEGGGAPPDWRADPRVQHPRTTDIPAEFTVGQEYLVAHAYRLLGGEVPIHVVATWVMSFTAALALVGAYLLAGAAAGGRRSERGTGGARGGADTGFGVWCGALAALGFLLLPANFRTIGFVMVREDLAFPLFALHLGFLAAALRRPATWRFAWSGCLLAAALSTWHAMGFLVAIELSVLLAWSILSGARVSQAAALALALPTSLALLFVPALAQGSFPTSPAVCLGIGLLVLLLAPKSLLATGGWVRRSLLGGGSALAVAIVLRFVVSDPDAYGHVHDVLVAKVSNLGRLPGDPNSMSFDARLLWQGPFATLEFHHAWRFLGLGLLALPASVWLALRKGALASDRALAALFGVSLLAAWLVQRMVILPGLLVPVVLAVAYVTARAESGPLVRRIALGVAGLQLLLFGSFVAGHVVWWYQPPARQAELRDLVSWFEANVPAEEAVVSDFVTSTALLQGAGNPIVLQPKYETVASRRDAEAFLLGLYTSELDAFGRLCSERFAARYLVIDRHVLLKDSLYLAGSAPHDRSAILSLASTDPDVLANIAGFELLFRTRDSRLLTDRYRVFRLTE